MSKRLVRIKALAAQGNVAFIDLLLDLLSEDFDRYLKALRNQKVLNASRDVAIMRGLARELRKRLTTASLSLKEKKEIDHHVDVCLAFQALFDELNQRGTGLDIWDFGIQNILAATLDYIEQSSVAHLKEFFDTYPTESSARSRLKHADKRDRSFRDDCDSALIVINQARIRAKGTDHGIPAPDSVRKALELASEFQFVLLLFDFYSFRGWKTKVDRHRIRVIPRVSPIEIAREYSHLRKQALDDISVMKEVHTAASITDAIVLNEDAVPNEFETFILDGQGQKLFKELRVLRDKYRDNMRRPIEEVFNLSDRFRIGDRDFTVRDVLESWAFLRRLMACVRTWQGAVFIGKSLPNKTAIISRETVMRLAAEDLMLPPQEVERQLEIFSNAYPLHDVDLFYRPLSPVPGDKMIIATSYIELSRFDRNILPILLENSDYDVSPKGFKPLRSLAQTLKSRGLRVVLDTPLVRSNQVITDIDCAVVKGNHLFIAQVKVLRESDSVYEEWRIDSALEHAARQLALTVRHVNEDRKETQSMFGLVSQEFTMVPFILTNVFDLSGAEIHGFSVIDFDYLEQVTRPELVAVRPDYLAMNVIQVKSVPEETLRVLIETPTVRSHFENPRLRDEQIVIGSFTISCGALIE